MATAEKEIQYAIESRANSLLNQVTEEVANLVLFQATQKARERNPVGTPVITTEDILASAQALVKVLQNAEHWIEEKEEDAETSKNVLAALSRMREAIETLSSSVRDAK